MTTELSSLITRQHIEYTVEEDTIKTINQEVKNEKESTYNKTMEHLKDNHALNIKNTSAMKYRDGIFNCFTLLPFADYCFELTKQISWDSISLRYD